MLNRKIVRRILESENERLPNCYIKEADDGITALEMVTSEAACGIHFDFILIDYIMVLDFISISIVKHYYLLFTVENARAGSC